MRLHKHLMIVGAVVICAALVSAAPAFALPPTFTASSPSDEPDLTPGDGRCLTATFKCTLRAAVQEANALGGATINLLPGVTYILTRTGASEYQAATGDLDLGSNTTITVPGGRAGVVGGPGWDDRIFDVHFNANVALRGVDISGGQVQPRLAFGGGILNSGTLTVTDSRVLLNAAALGGGIDNTGNLTLTSSVVSNNAASGHCDACGLGGGISNRTGGTATVTKSTVSLNLATRAGGGIFTNARVTLTGSTVSGNTAWSALTGGGGGVALGIGGSLSAVNSTISTNAAQLDGGGIYNLGTADLNNVTIADNVADSDGNGSGDGGGIINVAGGVVSVANSIVGDNVDASATSKFPDCLGSLTGLGFTLVENTTGCTIGGVTTGNITGRDPRLGPLQAGGGATATHALLSGSIANLKLGPSPAIDSGNPLFFGQPCSRDVSQNGVTRPVDGNGDGISRCDIGAYELPPQLF